MRQPSGKHPHDFEAVLPVQAAAIVNQSEPMHHDYLPRTALRSLQQITGCWQRQRANQMPTLQNSKPIQFFNNLEHPECRNCEHHAERHLCTAKPHYRLPAKNVTF